MRPSGPAVPTVGGPVLPVPSTLLAVGIGGALGAGLRHGAAQLAPETMGAFGWTTFVVNVVGAFLLAGLPALALLFPHPLLPPALGSGLLGGFTTMSAVSDQTRGLLDVGRPGVALAYLLGTLVTALLAVGLAERLSARATPHGRLDPRRSGPNGTGPGGSGSNQTGPSGTAGGNR